LKFVDYINEKLHIQIEPFFAEHFDLDVTQYYFENSNKLPANLRYYGRTANSDLLIKNYFQLYYNGISFINHIPIEKAASQAIYLIKSLKKAYHLK